jgi:hypothetical protein
VEFLVVEVEAVATPQAASYFLKALVDPAEAVRELLLANLL